MVISGKIAFQNISFPFLKEIYNDPIKFKKNNNNVNDYLTHPFNSQSAGHQ